METKIRKIFKEQLKNYAEELQKEIKVLAETENYMLTGTKIYDEDYGKNLYNFNIHTTKYDIKFIPEVFMEINYTRGIIEKAQINWSAYGSVDFSEAEEFKKNLEEAIEFVKMINGKDFSKEF